MTRIAGPTLVDGHVHLHAEFSLGRFLSAAAHNFERRARALEVPVSRPAVLALTEGWDEGAAVRLERAADARVPGWEISPCADGLSFRASGTGAAPRDILIVRGHQVVTSEDLEVQAIGCASAPPRGLPLGDTIAEALDRGAAAVLPWGFGKWWGRRGRLVREALDSRAPGEVLLGVSGGRLRGAPLHRLLREAPARGIPVIAGTDPFPFDREERVVGTSGFLCPADLDSDRPGASLVTALRDLRASPVLFGRGRGPAQFLRSQIQMQWRKRAPTSLRASEPAT